jgi:hypothetical protein
VPRALPRRLCVERRHRARRGLFFEPRRRCVLIHFKPIVRSARTQAAHGAPSVIWVKTDAGRVEIRTRALVKERARRNLLLLIDGSKTEETLLAGLAGIGAEDFRALEALALIAKVATPARSADTAHRAAAKAAAPPVEAAPAASLGHAQLTAALMQLISTHLGLRGFVLTLAVEKAETIEELQAVAQRTLEQIRERRGEAAAAAARQILHGV